jgi:hypothetical protein
VAPSLGPDIRPEVYRTIKRKENSVWKLGIQGKKIPAWCPLEFRVWLDTTAPWTWIIRNKRHFRRSDWIVLQMVPRAPFPLLYSIYWLCQHRWRWWTWSSRNENWQGKLKYSEKTCPSATLSTTNHTWPDLGSKWEVGGYSPELWQGRPWIGGRKEGVQYYICRLRNVTVK